MVLARINLSIFDIFILYGVTSTRILEFLDDFSGFISLSINGGLPSHCLLLAVLYNRLLADGLSHASAHSEAARLKTAESTASHIAATHHHSASHTTESRAKEIIIVVESSTHHAEITEWIPPLFGPLGLLLVHVSTESHAHLRETASKEVIILIVKEAGKRIVATEKVPEYFVSALHIEMVKSLPSTSSE